MITILFIFLNHRPSPTALPHTGSNHVLLKLTFTWVLQMRPFLEVGSLQMSSCQDEVMLDEAGPQFKDWCPCEKRETLTYQGTEAIPREGGGRGPSDAPTRCRTPGTACDLQKLRGTEQLVSQSLREKTQACPHLAFGLAASRTLKECVPVVLSLGVCGPLGGQP